MRFACALCFIIPAVYVCARLVCVAVIVVVSGLCCCLWLMVLRVAVWVCVNFVCCVMSLMIVVFVSSLVWCLWFGVCCCLLSAGALPCGWAGIDFRLFAWRPAWETWVAVVVLVCGF